jgi:hypothetical protein
MLTTIERPVPAQGTITPERALMLARQRFPNLCSGGILGRKAIGQPVDLWHVAQAVTVLAACRKAVIPRMHSYDLRAAIGGVTLGATIAAAVALGFRVDTWQGDTAFAPHCLIGVDPRDVERVAASFQ